MQQTTRSQNSPKTKKAPPALQRNWVLSAKSDHHYWKGTGALSIKTFRNGSAFYNAGRGCFAVNDSGYLLLNQDQEYSIEIDSREPVESFCIFFRRGFVAEVHSSLIKDRNDLLIHAEAENTGEIHFFERVHPHDDILSPLIWDLQRNCIELQPGWLEEQFHRIAEALIQSHFRELKQTQVLSAVRASTREELYRRLYRTRDYMEAMFSSPITLDEMAAVACLSSNHLLRSFRALFRETPHQYLVKRRLQAACELLSRTDKSITDICLDVGFESLGSFSWLFRKRFGESPEHWRKKVIFKKSYCSGLAIVSPTTESLRCESDQVKRKEIKVKTGQNSKGF